MKNGSFVDMFIVRVPLIVPPYRRFFDFRPFVLFVRRNTKRGRFSLHRRSVRPVDKITVKGCKACGTVVCPLHCAVMYGATTDNQIADSQADSKQKEIHSIKHNAYRNSINSDAPLQMLNGTSQHAAHPDDTAANARR